MAIDKSHPDVTVKIGGKPRVLRWVTSRAAYREGKYDLDLSDVSAAEPRKAFSAAIDWLFAMLDDISEFRGPDELSMVIKDEESTKIGDAISEAIDLAAEVKQPEDGKSAEKKRIRRSKAGRSAGSNSA